MVQCGAAMRRESRRTVAPAAQAAAPRSATRTAQTGWAGARRVRGWFADHW
jgi:hypothetical protein